MTEHNFPSWFQEVARTEAFPYQCRLAEIEDFPSVLRAITGAGKTAAAILGWLWRRCVVEIPGTPRRLIYCLPMRSLVEQTVREVQGWLTQAGLSERVRLQTLMGGTVAGEWDIYPEQELILVGTQDQLLSRALNRGYGMSRYRWPIHFALLNNDCLWVVDEVQLMGAGLGTSAQLQGLRTALGTHGPARSLWMSATLDLELLRTPDFFPENVRIESLNAEDLAHPVLKRRYQARKRLAQADTRCAGKDDQYMKALAGEVLQEHQEDTLTLVVCNRVNRAQGVYKALAQKTQVPILLIHSRFRQNERKLQLEMLAGFQGIVVTTQALEAGIDLSARLLFTEISPWASFVQRCGRCNRRGDDEDARVYWIDVDLEAKGAATPYKTDELLLARGLLEGLDDVGLQSLEIVKAPVQVEGGLLPRRKDLMQLFDTTPDLAGHDIDVSPFIRDDDDTDMLFVWRTWEGNEPPSTLPTPMPEEFCRVGIGRAIEFLKSRQGWVWDSLAGVWIKPRVLRPGMIVLLHSEVGGYSSTLGFAPDSTAAVEPVSIAVSVLPPNSDAADPLSKSSQWVTLKKHAEDVAQKMQCLCDHFADLKLDASLLERSARWHDHGKVHTSFQDLLTQGHTLAGGPYAKSGPMPPQVVAVPEDQRPERRVGFRHELASALAALAEGEPFLLVYLVAAHHGKVRLSIRPQPNERAPVAVTRYARGIHEGDMLPPADLGNGLKVPEVKLSLGCMELGGGGEGLSWSQETGKLLVQEGPFRLAFLEMLVRIADWKASASYDTALEEGDV